MYKEKVSFTLRDKIGSYLATIIAVVAIISPLALVHAASSSYSFTMGHRVVDGCANGQFHPLSVGTGHISGSTSAPGSSLSVSYELEREVWGFNPSYGVVNGGINTSFSGTFPTAIDVTSSDYCLVIYRGNDDGITVNGSGTLYN